MNDQTLRSLDDQALMDVVGGGGSCYHPCESREQCGGGLEIRIDVDVSLCL
jgi:hypothetical protein